MFPTTPIPPYVVIHKASLLFLLEHNVPNVNILQLYVDTLSYKHHRIGSRASTMKILHDTFTILIQPRVSCVFVQRFAAFRRVSSSIVTGLQASKIRFRVPFLLPAAFSFLFQLIGGPVTHFCAFLMKHQIFLKLPSFHSRQVVGRSLLPPSLPFAPATSPKTPSNATNYLDINRMIYNRALIDPQLIDSSWQTFVLYTSTVLLLLASLPIYFSLSPLSPRFTSSFPSTKTRESGSIRFHSFTPFDGTLYFA